MGIKTVPQSPYSPGLALCDFWLFPKLRGCHYKTIEEMKKAVTKVIDTRAKEDFHGSFQKLLLPEEITSKGTRVSCFLSIKVLILKKSGNLFIVYIYIYIYIYRIK